MYKRKEWLDVPIRCDNCKHTNVIYVDNGLIYGRNVGTWPKVWYCPKCKAAVSCHPETYFPMGKMATGETRTARRRAHKHFDKLFNKYKLMKRSRAYAWLARVMGIPKSECHMSYFNAEQCEEVVRLSKEYVRTVKAKPVTLTHRNGRRIPKRGQRRKKI